ncbi:ATP synthase subunit gamma [Salpingoeca rosetta]|uniref:ATP synthase subunit gamma n=1 Tax=Salpingoeca rosetta (strain ATCC 50818 / BSB-021) TaxID=946362 RepID=F2U2Q0_SALR5|nr:ATP synthase subunit gamma [Salpingoeca rosetta]EGD81894.1 ATP synthase subunit gamma [Salpingoeca rosetta]|eukprot:XP_004996077.1 ATP synthase subunit gamma [Salpingoeca rosetta]
MVVPAMLSSTRVVGLQMPNNARTMATLKQISMRLKSVSNIQKITQSMKMVSSAKFKRAEDALKRARPIGAAAQALNSKGGITADEAPAKRTIVAVSSDRGLCGGIHSGLSKSIRAAISEFPDTADYQITTVGDKPRGILMRTLRDKITLSANEVGRLPPTFGDASFFAQELLASGYDADTVDIYYNQFKSAVSYAVSTAQVPSVSSMEGKPELDVYDDVDSETLRSYQEFSLASNLFYALVEAQAAEQSSRMTAMENASKNAGEMIEKLQLTFNRTRQAVITRELIEIISGAAALD